MTGVKEGAVNLLKTSGHDTLTQPATAKRVVMIGIVCGIFLIWAIVARQRDAEREQRFQPQTKPSPPATEVPLLTSAEHLEKAKAILAKPEPNLPDLQVAESHLKQIKPDHPESKTARRLEGQIKAERQKISKMFAEATRKTMISVREEAAKELERRFLRSGLDVHVKLSGKDKTVITMEYVLWSRPLIYQLGETQFLENLKKSGFKKAIFADGHRYTWTFDLDK